MVHTYIRKEDIPTGDSMDDPGDRMPSATCQSLKNRPWATPLTGGPEELNSQTKNASYQVPVDGKWGAGV